MSPLRLAPPIAVLLIVTGCQSAGHLTGARTLDEGQTRVGVAVGATAWISGDVVMPGASVQAQLNHGITDHVEFGINGGSGGLGLTTKLGLVRPESSLSGFNLAIEPGVSAGPIDGRLMGTLRIPLLLGYRFGGHEVTLAPRVQYSNSFTRGWPPENLSAGGSLGARFRAGPHLVLSPEVGWMHPLVRGASFDLLPIVNLGFAWES